MARVMVAALILSHAAAASAGNNTSNLRGRSLKACDYRCPENSRRKLNRRCYDTFDDCRCERGFKKEGNKCVSDEPCIMIRCSRDQVLVGADRRGCGGRCESNFCVQIQCSRDQVLVGADSRGCGGKCEPKFCAQLQCSSDQILVGADSRGCGGRCEPRERQYEPPTTRGMEFYWEFDSSYCMSVDDNTFKNGQKMQLWKCAGSSGQYFDYSPVHHSMPALLRVAEYPDFCVVIDGNKNQNGAGIQLWRCDFDWSTSTAQRWWLDSGRIVNAAFTDKCLVVDSNKGANGQRLQLWSCDGSEQYKTWGRAV